MIITDITPQKRRKDRYNLYCEEGFLLSLSDETIVKNSIKKGADLSSALIEKLRREDTLKYAKELAASFISYCPRTRREVITHLEKKGIDSVSAEQAADMLEEYRYIDDEKYAREFSRIYSSKLGSRMIKQKLMQKGISSEAAEAASKANSQTQMEAGKKICEKYAKKYAALDSYERNKKIYAALIRKGFSYDEASMLVKEDEDVYE